MPALRWSVLVALTTLLAVALGGVAWAAWVSSGSGTSTAKAGSALAPTVTAGTAATSGLLYPTGTGTVVLTVGNPNPYPVRVVSVAANGAPTASGGTGSCSTTGVTLTTQTPGTAIAARGSATITLPNAAAMSSASETGCQNATFSIPVTVTVESG